MAGHDGGTGTDEGGEAACALATSGEVVDALTDSQLAELVRDLPDAVIIADRVGDILLWNAAATRLLGWTSDEIVGRPLDLIVPERLRARHDAGYHRTMENGITRYGESLLRVPALHRDGHTISVAFTVALMFRPGHKAPYAIAAVMRADPDWKVAKEREAREAREAGTVEAG